MQAVDDMANTGRTFQLLTLIDSATRGITHPWPLRLVKNLNFYRTELSAMIRVSGLDKAGTTADTRARYANG